jgi:hypothetical protein
MRLVVLGLAAGLAGALSFSVSAQDRATLVFSAGAAGGMWTPMAVATAEVIGKRFPELDVRVEPGSTVVNMEKLRNDQADLGWSLTSVLHDAREGRGSWSGRRTGRPMYVATYYPNVWHLVVPAGSPIRANRDLKGKPVALPARGTTSLTDGWEVVLEANDMSVADLGPKSYGSIGSNVEAFKRRQAMAIGWFTVVPGPFVVDVGATTKLRMIPVSDSELAKIRAVNPGFVRHVVRAGTYTDQGVAEDVATFQTATILVASSRAPADVIYKVTRAIVEGRDRFGAVAPVMKGIAPADMAHDYGLPYHPGAARYYKEIGALK